MGEPTGTERRCVLSRYEHNGEINHIYPIFTAHGLGSHFQASFGPCDVTSANIHAFDSAVLIQITDVTDLNNGFCPGDFVTFDNNRSTCRLTSS